MDQVGKGRVGYALPAEGDDEHATAEGVDIGGRMAKPGDELLVGLILAQKGLPIAQHFVSAVSRISEKSLIFYYLQLFN